MGIYDSSVAFNSRQKELQDIGLTGQDDLQVGFGERFTSANQLTFNRYTPEGRDRAFEDIYAQRDEILINAGLIEDPLLTTKRLTDRRDSGNYPALNSDLLGRPTGDPIADAKLAIFEDFEAYLKDNEHNDQLLMDLRAAHPELNIQSDEEIASQVVMDQTEILHRDEDLAERSTFLGKAGYLTGSMVGWVRDPVHFLSSLAGLSPAGRLSMAQNFLRVGAAEAAIVTALEVAEKPKEIQFRRLTGEESLTVAQAELESALTIGTSFVIGGAIGAAIGRFTRPIARSATGNNAVNDATQATVDKIRTQQAKGTIFDPEVEQAADLLDESLQIARGAPEDVTYETHMNNYAEARKAIAEGDNVPGAEDLGAVKRASDVDVDAPVTSETAVPNAVDSVQDLAIADLRATLTSQDVTTRTTSPSGEITAVSSRQVLADLDAEDAAIKATITCLG